MICYIHYFGIAGRATITIVNPDKRQAYNLEYGDALILPNGITSYILNPNHNQNLRVVKLALPINNPGNIYSRYKEIQRILLGNKDEHEDEEQSHRQEKSHQEEGVIVRVSKEQIQELRKHAQSLLGNGKPSEFVPFNLRSNEPIYSNKFGNFYEITLDRNPQA
ncbi:hypothetical protein TanjilG_21204 [Lupinus angustifolius]|uniref:Cupin type-1 domain-containing protein n=1 Tax=Lupinus angustifolius TaxID=3871 RepID=A0A4P1R8U5_LUPAN|nr:hypothetical protein TanjilG_21204 [Lupinus angustifolius]